jgi:hypothetical protein
MAITPLPDAPLTTDTPQQFNTKAFIWVQSLETFVTEANAQAVTVNSDASSASTAKTDAETAANEAETFANLASASANITKWISGTTYDEGDVVWSPITYLGYRRKSTGGGTTDPSLDTTNWEQVAGAGFRNIPAIAEKTAAYTIAVGDVGKVVNVGSGGSIEIPDAIFAAGDAVLVFNNTTGDVTITCTITTAYIAAADADVASVTLSTRGVCNILFLSGTACVLTGNIA